MIRRVFRVTACGITSIVSETSAVRALHTAFGTGDEPTLRGDRRRTDDEGEPRRRHLDHPPRQPARRIGDHKGGLRPCFARSAIGSGSGYPAG